MFKSKSIYPLLILAMFFWGGYYVLGKAVSGSIPPITLSYLRWMIALIFLAPLCWQELLENKIKFLHNWKYFLLVGFSGIMGYSICVFTSLRYTTAINSGIINSFCPVFITILAVIFLKEKISKIQTAGIILSFIGVTWIISKGQLSTLLSFDFNNGDILMLGAVFFWGIYTILLRIKRNIVPLKSLLAFSIIWGLLITWPLVLIENLTWDFNWISNLTSFHILSVLYMGTLAAVFSFLVFNKAVNEIGPSRAAMFQHLVVVFAAILSITLLHEKLTFAHLVGTILIVTGVYLTTQKGLLTSEHPDKKRVINRS